MLRCRAQGRDPAQVKAGEMAQGAPHWVDARSDVDKVLTMMEDHRIRRMPVMADHRLVGMISDADLAQHHGDHQLAHFVETVCAGK